MKREIQTSVLKWGKVVLSDAVVVLIQKMTK
jgi:hypothetical protein